MFEYVFVQDEHEALDDQHQMSEVAQNQHDDKVFVIVFADAFVQQSAVVVEMTNTSIAGVAVGAQWGSPEFAGFTFAVRVNVAFWLLVCVCEWKSLDVLLVRLLELV